MSCNVWNRSHNVYLKLLAWIYFTQLFSIVYCNLKLCMARPLNNIHQMSESNGSFAIPVRLILLNLIIQALGV